MRAIISIENLSKSFGRKQVIKNLNLSIPEGEFFSLVGPNGSGKTTLIKIISTLMKANSGKVIYDDYDINENPLEIRRIIGVISHNTYLYDELSAKENLTFYGRMFSYPKQKLDDKIKSLLKEVGLEHRMNDRVATYSMGMKQRLSIARAVLHEPRILLFDEPFSGLDTQAVQSLKRILKGFHRKNHTILMTTNDLERGFELCDRVAILSKGRIIFDKKKNVLNIAQFKKIYLHELGGT